MSESIEIGDTVTFNYEGRIEDGSTFHTFDEDPLVVEIGSGSLVKGLEEELIGMKTGEEKEFKVSPEQGYGEENPEMAQTVEAKLFAKADITPKVGMVLKTPHGNCHITEILEDTVKISYNHPLAGRALDYKVRVLNIVKKS